MQKKLIAVDDSIPYLNALKSILKSQYDVYIASSAAMMFELLARIKPDLILLDVDMPEMCGYNAAKLLMNNRDYKDIPIIFSTSKGNVESEIEGLDYNAIDHIYEPFTISLLLKQIETKLSLADINIDLEELNATVKYEQYDSNSSILELKDAVINIVSELVEFRDNVTGRHLSRTQTYLYQLINKLKEVNIYCQDISAWDLDLLLPSAQLHDIGKIAISDLILKKPSSLTADEYAIMKTHAQAGVDVINLMEKKTTDNAFFKYAKTFAGTHHEKWNGTGYPNGLKGTDIPLEGRLMAIVDVYDALVSTRPYKEAFSPVIASQIIQEGSGACFDPKLVDVFNMLSDEFAEISSTII